MDSQAALKALDSCVDYSKTIMESRRSLNVMAKDYKITLIWVPRHQDIEGNCIPDELARKGTTIEAACKLFIKQGTLRQTGQRWKNATNYEIFKQTRPCRNLKRTKTILVLRKSTFNNVLILRIEQSVGLCCLRVANQPFALRFEFL